MGNMPDVPVMKAIALVLLVYMISFPIPFVFGKKNLQLVVPLVGILGIVFQWVVNRDERFGKVGFRLGTPAVYFQSFLVIGGLLLVVLAAGFATGKLRLWQKMDAKRYAKLGINVLLLWVQNAIFALFTEELVFRGLVQRQLSQSISPIASILIASTAFGVWHAPLGRLSLGLNNRQTVLYALGTGLVGAVFGAFYHQSQSLVVSGFVHGAWNALVYAIWGLGDEFPSLLVSKDEAWTHPEYGVIGVMALSLAVPLLLATVV
jgi:membrane protease YdiL (CAAX protease family)